MMGGANRRTARSAVVGPVVMETRFEIRACPVHMAEHRWPRQCGHEMPVPTIGPECHRHRADEDNRGSSSVTDPSTDPSTEHAAMHTFARKARTLMRARDWVPVIALVPREVGMATSLAGARSWRPMTCAMPTAHSPKDDSDKETEPYMPIVPLCCAMGEWDRVRQVS